MRIRSSLPTQVPADGQVHSVSSLAAVSQRLTFITVQHMNLQFSSDADKTLGACEALCHWRGTIELLIMDGTLEPMAAADQDLVDMFGNADTNMFMRLAPGEWQQRPHPVSTPPSAPGATNRRAEQGDVFGTVHSVLVLGEARSEHMQQHLSSSFAKRGFCDEWFDDDEQVFVRPALFKLLAPSAGRRQCHLWSRTWHPELREAVMPAEAPA